MNQEHHGTKPAPQPDQEQHPREDIDSLGQYNPAETLQRKTIQQVGEINKKKEEEAKKQSGETTFPEPQSPAQHTHEKVDYEAKTVPELRELAKERNVEISWDARKDEIVSALEKQDKKEHKL